MLSAISMLVGYRMGIFVGTYFVKLFNLGVWIPIIVDVIFPLFKNANLNIVGCNALTGRNAIMSILFVIVKGLPITREAIKLFPFVHHALEDLTGCDRNALCEIIY